MRDAQVRAAVRLMLTKLHGLDTNTRIVEEMGVWSGSVRIDIAVINGELSGFELKSDRDTLERLPLQAELYSRVFDRVVLVAGARHVTKASERVPSWWGITVATLQGTEIVLTPTRCGERNPCPDPYLVAQLLWKDEAVSVLEAFNLAKGWRSRNIKAMHQRLAAELPFDTLAERVRETLKLRNRWSWQKGTNQLDMSINADLDPRF